MTSRFDELRDATDTTEIALRMALAEAEVEISLLKVELSRTKQRLSLAEAALRNLPSESPDGTFAAVAPSASSTTFGPPSSGLRGKVCTVSSVPSPSGDEHEEPTADQRETRRPGAGKSA